ncbi:MAG: adenylate kinase family protein [Candidatus Helarchaeota archaeon]
MKKIVILSGTPGTGKTTVANRLKDSIPAKIIDINYEVIENKIFSVDPDRNTKIADFKTLKAHLVKKIKQIESVFVIVEGHYADIIPNKLVYKAIILRTHPEILKKRLGQRNFEKDKVSENLQAEILGDCTYHAINAYDTDKIFEVDNSRLTIEQCTNRILEIITKDKKDLKSKKIDWLHVLEKDEKLSKYFD